MRRFPIYIILSVLIVMFTSGISLAGEFEMHSMAHFSASMIIPFALLLCAIAVMPFLNRHWWEHNYHLVSFGLGLLVILYYLIYIRASNGFADVTGITSYGWHKLIHTGVEYYSFIALIGSLFVVSGGIFIRVNNNSTPLVNTAILLIGAIAANFLGTTGASMLLIRPFLRINKDRVKGYQVVFFIFIVSNIGGSLTPIGDPPLFLGYLKGVPFFWVIGKVWHIWLLTTAIVLIIFYLIDSRYYARVKGKISKARTEGKMEILGKKNFIYLFMVLVLVLLQKAEFIKHIEEGIGANGQLYITIIIATLMIIVSAIAYKSSNREAIEANEFNFGPIKEVAILFIGIFATMIPALDYLEQNAAALGINTYGQFYWGSGILSSVLDNAPTYLNFLSASFGLANLSVDTDMAKFLDPGHVITLGNGMAVHTWKYVQAISLGSVFFGANTYIGNGPNFMVKSIAEQSGVECPSFFAYVYKYSLPVLIPVYALVWFLFFR
ncbi:MAG: sodium:proton antiporter [Nitrospirae bacterium]|nr:sodium:proton antiporter [Nitrospirota bacterium]